MAICSELTVAIANGESLSGAIHVGNRAPVLLIMPAAWTTADVTLQGSQDGSTYNDVYDRNGNEYTITAAAARLILLDVPDIPSVRWLKLRSGTTGTAVNQGAARSLTLVVREV